MLEIQISFGNFPPRISQAYQTLGKHEMAIVHYHSHLNIARELKDVAGKSFA